MEKPPEKRTAEPNRPVWVRWLVIFGAVWVLLAITYGILTIQSTRKHHQLVDNGLARVEKLADMAALPLLEQDIKSLHGMLKEIGDRPDVLYASVIDHKNKIIAYTDAGRLLPERAGQVQQHRGVDTWQDQEAMVFSKAVNFAGTPIGEIRLALSLAPVITPLKRFGVIAAAAVAILLLLLLWVHGRQWARVVKTILRGRRTHVNMKLIMCPMCGQTAGHDAAFCDSSNMDNAPIVILSGNGTQKSGQNALRLGDIGANPKLAPVKDQMIRQCAEIIKRLAADEPSAVR